MIEVFQPPVYFAWRFENGLPYVIHFYVRRTIRSFPTALKAIREMRRYFRERGMNRILMNARSEEPRIQKAIEHHFRVKPYAQADGHHFYFVEV